MGVIEEALDRILLWMFRVWLPVVLLCASATALDPGLQISQYAHTAWRMQDGAFSGAPHVITQTTDGYLWIGTEAGLVRFDGVRFVPWTPPKGKQLPSLRIFSLKGASDGSLWIGTGSGLAHWNNEELVSYPTGRYVESILQDPMGKIWLTRSHVQDDKGALCEIADNALRCHGLSEGIPFTFASALLRDDLGNFWIGGSPGLCRWKPGSAQTYLLRALQVAPGFAGVSAIARGPNGTLWVGIVRAGKDLGLRQLVQGTWKDYVVPGVDGSTLEVTDLLMDRDNALWIGTLNQEIYRVHDGKADHFRSTDGLSSDSVYSFYEDHEGDLWVVTSRGIDRFHDLSVASFSMREGLTSEHVGSVLAVRDGTLWVGNTQALDFLRQGRLSEAGEGKNLPGQVVTALFEDHAGRLWVGLDSGLTIYARGRFHPVNKPDGSGLGIIAAIAEDIDHNVWAVGPRSVIFRIQDLQVREEIDAPRIPRAVAVAANPQGGIWLGLANGNLVRYRNGQVETISTNHGSGDLPVWNLLVEPDGSLWAASGNGLIRWKEGKLNTLTSGNGLPCNSLITLAKDDLGSLWLETQCGLVAITDSELEKWWERPDTMVKVRTFDVFDGVQPAVSNFRPEVAKSSDGKLWFATNSILQMVDPSHLEENRIPPPVHVEEIVADRKKYLPQADLRLPARTRNVEIDFTALSFVVPEKVKFRYKLEGHDADWLDSQTRRQAFYNDLPPGNYKFRVIASNNDGIWNETGATEDFTVLPAFFQTTWFRMLGVVTAAGILWLLYTLRLRQLGLQMQTRLEERIEERERIARDLHDTLLQGFFSAAMQLDVANDRLPANSPAKPIVQRVIELMRQVGEEGRDTVRSLRSSHRESSDLDQAFARIREEFPDQEGIAFSVTAEGSPRPLKPVVWDEVYRLGREAVINAFHHSGASKIEVEVEYTGHNLRVLVGDDGCGIDPQVLETGREGHWGLPGMRERAEKMGAKLIVLSRPGAGTEIELSIPGNVAFESISSDRLPEWLTRLFQGKRKADRQPRRER